MSIKDLFCTPEQGARLKELLPKLKCSFDWPDDHPALTLQELRDVILKSPINTDWSFTELSSRMCGHNAPELADWVIEILEAQP